MNGKPGIGRAQSTRPARRATERAALEDPFLRSAATGRGQMQGAPVDDIDDETALVGTAAIRNARPFCPLRTTDAKR